MTGAPQGRPTYERITHPTNQRSRVTLQLILNITISKKRVYFAYYD